MKEKISDMNSMSILQKKKFNIANENMQFEKWEKHNFNLIPKILTNLVTSKKKLFPKFLMGVICLLQSPL